MAQNCAITVVTLRYSTECYNLKESKFKPILHAVIR